MLTTFHWLMVGILTKVREMVFIGLELLLAILIVFAVIGTAMELSHQGEFIRFLQYLWQGSYCRLC